MQSCFPDFAKRQVFFLNVYISFSLYMSVLMIVQLFVLNSNLRGKMKIVDTGQNKF